MSGGKTVTDRTSSGGPTGEPDPPRLRAASALA
jgi:hypothetical protein